MPKKKIEEIAGRISRWLRRQLGDVVEESPSQEDGEEHSSHPGKAYHAKTVLGEPHVREHAGGRRFRGNPHVGSWKKYTTHLFSLMLDGYGHSPAAMQVRDRLNTHWKLLTEKERTQCLRHYRREKRRYAEAKVERDTAAFRHDRDWLFTKDLYAEVEEFMSPKVH